MTSEQLVRLTEKERAALRLVPTHGTIIAIAGALGISESAVKLRLASAAKKLGVIGRHEAARLLMEAEGWPYPKRTVANEQVVPGAEAALVYPTPGPPDRVEGVRERPIEAPSLGDIAVQMAARRAVAGGRNRFTLGQRITVIVIFVMLGALLFAMVLATITETGRFGRSLRTIDRTSI